MSNVDKRVVQMEFDNKQFEKDMQTTIKSLQNFEKNINSVGKNSTAFEGIGKGLDNVKSSIKSFSLDTVSNAFDRVKVSISGWEMAAMAAITNVVTGAMNAAKNMAKSLVVDPVSQGFSEYELKMNSIQTMMLGSGASLDQVNKKLEELNTYADRTIYSFSDMTQNIGKFINAGVSLDDAVSAIQGVSNVAAISGANANEASRAMYNFAQALSSGSIRLIDWKSIENANMATVQFKQELLDTALALGTVTKVGDDYQSTTKDLNGKVSEAFNSTKKFNDSLSAQWMTSEVLIETLKRYTDETTNLGKQAFAAAQDVKTFHQLMDTLKEAVGSGWAQTWELIFGNFEEAKVLWTSISNVVGGFIDRQSKARNELLKSWAAMGGRATFFESLKNIVTNISEIMNAVQSSFRDVFQGLSAGKLVSFSKSLANLSYILKPTKEELIEIREVFTSLFRFIKSTTEPLRRAWKEAFPSGTIISFARNFLSLIGNIIKSLTDSFNALTDNGEVIHNVAFTIFSVLRTGVNILTFLLSVIKSIIKVTAPIATFLGKIIGYIVNIVTELGSLIFKSNAIRQSIVKVTNSINKLVAPLKDGLLYVFGLLQPYLDRFKEWALSGAKWLGDNLAKGIEFVASGIENLVINIKKFISGFSSAKNITDGAKNKLSEYKDKVKETSDVITEAVKKNNFLSTMWTRVSDFFGNIWSKVSGFFSSIWANIQPYAQKGVDKIREIFGTAFDSIRQNGLFASAGSGLGSIIGNIGKGISIMIENLIPMKDKILEFFGEDSVAKLIKDFVKVFLGLKAGKMFDFFGKLGDSVKSFTGAIDKITKTLQKVIKTFSKRNPAKMFRDFAIGIGIIVASLFVISKIDGDALMPSVIALSALIAHIAGIFVVLDQLTKRSTGLVTRFASMALLMLAIGSAISKIAIVIGILSLFNSGKLAIATALVAGITALMGAFIILFARWTKSNNGITYKRILSLALLMETMGRAIKSVAIVIGILSLFNSGKLAIATALVAGITALMGAFVILFARITKSDNGMDVRKILAFSLLVKAMGQAIKGIGVVIGILALLDMTKVLAAGTIVGAITVLMGILLGLLSLKKDTSKYIDVAKSMIILASAIAIMSVAIRKLAKGDLKQTMSAVIMLIGSLTILSGILIGLSVFSAPIATLSAAFLAFGIAAAAFGAGIYLVIKSVESLKRMGPAAINIMTDVITAVVSNIPKWVGILITGLLEHLAKMIPTIVQSLIKIIISVIEGITSGIGAIVTAIGKLFKAIVTTLSQYSNAFKIEDLFWAVQSIALIAGLIFVLQIIASDMKAALKGIGLMAAVLGLLVGALLIINNFTNPTQSIGILQGVAQTLVSLTAVMGVMVAACVAFEHFKVSPVAIIKAVLAIAVIMLAMAALVGLIGGIVTWLESIGVDMIGVFQKGAQIMRLTGEAIGGFMAGTVDSLTKSINGQNAGALLALVPLILALEPLVGALPILAVFIGAIGGITAAIESIPGIENGTILKIMQKAAEVMGGMGEALGQFIGGFVNGVMKQFTTGLMDSLIMFADGLNSFMDHMTPFINALQQVNKDTLDKVGILTLIILELCAVELVQGIASFFSFFVGGSSISRFAEELEKMGEPLVNFSNKLKQGNFNAGLVTSAAIAAKILAEMANILPRSGGLASLFAGETMDMDAFGKKLGGLGLSLVAFSTSISQLTEDDTKRMESAANTVSMLASVANSMPKHGGWLQTLLGDVTDMDVFGTQLTGLGAGLMFFAAEVKAITPEQKKAVDLAIPVLESLVKIANDMPNSSGSVWGKLFGDQMDIGTFGGKLQALGQGIANFAVATKDVDKKTVTSSESAIGVAEQIVALSKSLGEDKEGGIVSFFAGTSKETLDSFAEKLPKLGQGIRNFAAQVGYIENTGSVVPICEGIKALADAFKYTKDAGNFTDNFLKFLADFVNGQDDYTGTELSAVPGMLGEDPSGALWNIRYIKDAIIELSNAFKSTKDANDLNSDFLKHLHDFAKGEGDYKASDFLEATTVLGDKPADAVWKLHYIKDAIIKLSDAFKYTKDANNLNQDFLVHLNDFVDGEGDYTGDELKRAANLLGENPANAKANVDKLEMVKTAITTLSSAFKTVSDDGKGNDIFWFTRAVESLSTLSISAIRTDIADNANLAVQAINDLIFKMGQAILDKKEPLKSNVTTMLSGFTEAIDNFDDGTITRIETFIDDCLKAFGKYTSYDASKPTGFYLIGKQSIQGFVQGIRDNLRLAYNAGFDIGKEADKGTRNALVVKSPSRRYGETAYYSVMGFVNKFASMGNIVYNAGAELGQNALNGTKGIITRMADAINSDMNLQPVISPVLDLSEISAQSGYIGGILNTGASVSMASRTASLIEQGRLMRFEASISKTGSPDVVAAIDTLTSRMDSMESAILNRPIMLDKTKVSKEITPEVDRELGRRRSYSRRGN